MSLESETKATQASVEFQAFCADLHPFVWEGLQEGRMRRGVVTFGRLARKRQWRPAAIIISLHQSNVYPGADGEAVEAHTSQRFRTRSIAFCTNISARNERATMPHAGSDAACVRSLGVKTERECKTRHYLHNEAINIGAHELETSDGAA